MASPDADLPNPEVLFLEAQPRLTFGVKAAAVGCGISVRQLDWWTRVGYVPMLQSGRHRRYTANAVKIVLLIRAGLSMGLSLRRAADHARLLYPSLWEGAGATVGSEPLPTTELSAIRAELSRLSVELGELGRRLEQVPDPGHPEYDEDEE